MNGAGKQGRNPAAPALAAAWLALLAVLGWELVPEVALLTCAIPSLILFFLLSEYRDGRFFFTFCLSDTVCIWIMQLTNLLDRLCGGTYLFLSRLAIFPLFKLFLWKKLRRPCLELQNSLNGGW